MQSNRLSIILTFVALMLAANAFGQEKRYEVVIETDVGMKARHGETLRADIFRPKADGKFPVLLERTPYDKRRMTYADVGFGVRAATRGYVYIIQDDVDLTKMSGAAMNYLIKSP